MNIPGLQGGAYTAVFETDENGNFHSANGSVPGWLRDMIERAYANSGLRMNKKVASSEAIASLEEVPPELLKESTCPICYEKYEVDHNKKQKMDTTVQKEEPQPETSWAYENVYVEPESSRLKFKDPSLFMAVDAGAANPLRFPQQNLSNRETVTNEEMFPSLNDFKKPVKASKETRHIAMKMPNCHHVFGKTCIIEWLRGHVSCPLCRKEVESVRDSDPMAKKMETLSQNCNFIFAADQDVVMKHILRRSTNVFEPFKKPYNPAVTPLTDTSVSQHWARPSLPEGFAPDVTENADPQLIMARKYPLSNFQSTPRRSLFGRRNERDE
ncbi:hypothetical protein FT663_00563 [Candidozyma haemuli var. vulneris]|uniref:RING-type domain-containing protein n=1 Tax=Candidozyma haemuli TaxID=45357 RepID=A0A2V1B113_9ASCO|nr:hypothetical protein CXQ85_004037 [[Candida] haemuloni]KAF3993289.1 hypothetical protein FT662_00669 [[Candida] haemuloni var. vulneris]KAF3995345.1 hypothetical protein FT663_00563 [[Candida] haemuloni var. vulneris]PVH23744.1 hypothetical protein CXQ85_004037 [[Candida] haemuloni]